MQAKKVSEERRDKSKPPTYLALSPQLPRKHKHRPERFSLFLRFIRKGESMDYLALLKQATEEQLSEPTELPELQSNVFADALAQAQQLDQGEKYVLRLRWPTDDREEVARLVEPGQLREVLEAMRGQFPQTEGVVVCKLISTQTWKGPEPDLEPVLSVGVLDG